MNIYKYEFSYLSYLAEQSMNQYAIMDYIESKIINEDGARSSEKGKGFSGVIDGIKSLIKKLINSITKMWAKFTERLNYLFLENKKYLYKYEDIILNKKPLSRDVTMTEYDQKFLDLKVGTFDYNSMKDLFNEELDQNEFTKKYLTEKLTGGSELIPDFEANETIGGKIEKLYKKDDVQTNFVNIDMKSRYNFCMNFDKLTDDIKTDFENLEKSERELEKIIQDYKKKLEEKEKEEQRKQEEEQNKQQQQNTTNNNDQKNQNNGNNLNSSIGGNSNNTQSKKPAGESTYIRGYGYNPSFFSEDIKMGKAKTDAESTASKLVNSGNTSVDSDKAKADIESHDGVNFSNLQKNISSYFSICGDILGTKLFLCESQYKDNMQILKQHIKDHVGTE